MKVLIAWIWILILTIPIVLGVLTYTRKEDARALRLQGIEAQLNTIQLQLSQEKVIPYKGRNAKLLEKIQGE